MPFCMHILLLNKIGLFLLSGAYAPFIWNSLLKFVYISKFYVFTESFQQKKKTFYMVYVKIRKFGTKISHFATHLFIFFAWDRKNILFHETLCEHIECEDILAILFLYFFGILNFIFWIKGHMPWDQKCISVSNKHTINNDRIRTDIMIV
jgi:hypothetical protein